MGWKSVLEVAAKGSLIGLAASGIPGIAQGATIAQTLIGKDGKEVPAGQLPFQSDTMGRVDLIVASVERISESLRKRTGMPLTSDQKKAIAIEETVVILTESFALAGREVADKALLQEALNDMATGAGIIVEARLKFLKSLKVKVDD